MAASPIEKERLRKKQNKLLKRIVIILYIVASFIFLHWKALVLDSTEHGMKSTVTGFDIGAVFTHIVKNPLRMEITFGNILTLLGIAFCGFIAYLMYSSNKELKKHDNPETVKGEAHLMNDEELREYNLKFSAPLKQERNDGFENMIISKDIYLAIDNQGTRRNCNILVIGGSGAGKSRFFASPNILQYNANFVITDPSGEMLRDYGKALEDNGYNVKVFNLTDVYRSSRYNPFHYINDEKDIFTLVNTLIKNTTPPEAHAGDPFWENSEKLLITALVAYLWHVSEEKDQTFTQVVKMINMAKVDENDDSQQTPLDLLFEELRSMDPENLAVKQYDKFKLGAGKTLKSILISVGVRLQSFDLEDIQYLTAKDEFHFESFADTKQALFVIIPTADSTFNFLVSLMYSQLFSSLYTYAETRAEHSWTAKTSKYDIVKVEQAYSKEDSERAENVINEYVAKVKKGLDIEYDEVKKLYKIYTKKDKNGDRELVAWRGTKEMAEEYVGQLKNIKAEKMPCARCPYHVRLILDEFANIGQLPDFDQKLATMRKYEISCSIILQALSQLKDIYKDKWNTLTANCDTKLFLGCDDTETIKWMTEMLGKRTTTVENTSYQSKGEGSTSYNKDSQELLTIDQISMMADDECIVRIRGVRPYFGKKFELTEHKNYPYAKSVAGTFVIPLSENVKERVKGPLRKRNIVDAVKQAVQEAEAKGNVEDVVKMNKMNKSNDVVQKKKISKQKTNFIQQKKGKAIQRREDSKIAKEARKNMEVNPPAEIPVEEIEEMLGINSHEPMTEEAIQGIVETMITLEVMNMDNIQYGITQ